MPHNLALYFARLFSLALGLFAIHSGISQALATRTLHELNYAEAIEASPDSQDIVWLQADQQPFLALYKQSSDASSSTAVIILHDMNGHPNQARLIKPLRRYLPEHHWSTLALQLPVLGIAAQESAYYELFAEANTRIQAGINYLRQTGVKSIVIIGCGLGGQMAINALNKNPATAIKALVTISLNIPTSRDTNKTEKLDSISTLQLPFLDIFAEFDKTEVINAATLRRLATKSNRSYQQIKIHGENVLSQHNHDRLVKRVYSWISRTVTQSKQ